METKDPQNSVRNEQIGNETEKNQNEEIQKNEENESLSSDEKEAVLEKKSKDANTDNISDSQMITEDKSIIKSEEEKTPSDQKEVHVDDSSTLESENDDVSKEPEGKEKEAVLEKKSEDANTDNVSDSQIITEDKIISKSEEEKVPSDQKEVHVDDSSTLESENDDVSKEPEEKEKEAVLEKKSKDANIDDISDSQIITEDKNIIKSEEEKVPSDQKEVQVDDSSTPESENDDASKEPEEKEKEEKKERKREKINFSLLGKLDLVKILKEIVHEQKVLEYQKDVDEIKLYFYKKHKLEIEDKHTNFIKDGGREEDFSPGIDENELQLKELLKKFKELKHELYQVLESEKEENLKKKYKIIEEIKALVHNDESINKTFQDFKNIQQNWHNTGMVPQKDLKSLWENYHYHVEKFYDYIKINKELRDLDLKKNLELKISLCEKAEALDLDTNVVAAFQALQNLHDQWREIGPVPKEQRAEIWDRFKEATAKINRKHQYFYQDLKEQQKKNFDAKSVLCEKAENLSEKIYSEHIEWKDKTKEILELQKVWKTIGFAPKKDNNRIYARFRAACDRFFEQKRDFYSKNMEDQNENLKKKTLLCEKAETLMKDEDWKRTSDELIALQKKWKNIGPVSRKQSDEIWKRFRSACDYFFNKRNDFYLNMDSNYEENLKKKEALIIEIDAFVPTQDQTENIKVLNEYQRKWAEIGFVPIKRKDDIIQKYREVVNLQYDKFNIDEHVKNMLKFKSKIDNIIQKPKSEIKLRFEREKLMNRLQQIKSDIGVWENNIGFFANTKKADSMISGFEEKISSAKDKIKLLENKISFIDDIAPDL